MLASFEPSTADITFGTANLPQGTVRIFRDTILPIEESEKVVIPTTDDGCTLAVLAVPSYMTPADFLAWVDGAEEGIAHLRMIRYIMEFWCASRPADEFLTVETRCRTAPWFSSSSDTRKLRSDLQTSTMADRFTRWVRKSAMSSAYCQSTSRHPIPVPPHGRSRSPP